MTKFVEKFTTFINFVLLKTVIIAEPCEEQGAKAAKCLCDNFGMNKAIFLPCDVRCPKQLEDLFRYTVQTCKCVDIVLNNAGVMDDRNWEKSTKTNVNGAIRGILLANKYMSEKSGVVINTCATAGLMPWPNCPIFAAGKHAVVAAVRCLGVSKFFNVIKIKIFLLLYGRGVNHQKLWNFGFGCSYKKLCQA